MAKHRASRYLPGRRSAAWKKIKPARELPGSSSLLARAVRSRGVLVAVLCEGRLRYVADLRSGFTDALRRRLSSLLAERVQARPAVPCPEPGVWVRPELYCRVRFLAWTRGGRLRGASFGGLLPPTDSRPRRPTAEGAAGLGSILGQRPDAAPHRARRVGAAARTSAAARRPRRPTPGLPVAPLALARCGAVVFPGTTVPRLGDGPYPEVVPMAASAVACPALSPSPNCTPASSSVT